MTDQNPDLATLDALAALGMDLARAITAQGLESGDPASVAAAFAKVSRSIRQTILLKDRLLKGINHDRAERHTRRKIQLEDALNAIIEDEAQDSSDYERLHTEAAESLEFEDDDAILDLPFDEAIRTLRAAIGLDPDPSCPIGGGGPRGARWKETPPYKAQDLRTSLTVADTARRRSLSTTFAGPSSPVGEDQDGPPPPDD